MKDLEPKNTDEYTVGEYRVIASSNLIVHEAKETRITPKMVLVLTELAKNQGQTVSKDQLMKAVWGDTVISDMVLSKSISDLRRVFGDSAKQQSYIKTVSKKGYILLQDVNWNICSGVQVIKASRKQGTSYWKKLAYLIFVLSVIGFLYSQSSTKFSGFMRAPQVSNLTADNDTQGNPRYSPDGNYLVYSNFSNTDNNNSLDIVLYSFIKDTRTKIKTIDNSNGTGNNLSFAFSPDGGTLAIRIQNISGCTLLLFELLERTEKEISSCTRTLSPSIDWSLDGKTLTYSEYNGATNVSSIVLLDPTGVSDKKLVGNIKSAFGYRLPKISPDGTKIAVIKIKGLASNWEIGVINLRDDSYKMLLQTSRRINQITWVSAHKLAYVIEKGSSPGLWEVDLDTGKKTHIYQSSNLIFDLDYSKTKREYVFSEYRVNYEIWQSKKLEDGKIKEKEIQLKGWKNIIPRLSSDKQFLAYLSLASGVETLVVKNMTTGNEEKIFSEEDIKVTDFSWSPNGKTILATLVDNKGGHLELINPKTRARDSISVVGSVTNARWSTDGKKLYWLENDSLPSRLFEYDLKSKEVKVLLDSLKHQFELAGKDELYVRQMYGFNGEGRISKLSLKEVNSKSKIIYEGRGLASWLSKGDKLYYVVWMEDENNFMLVSYDNKTGDYSNLYRLAASMYLVPNQLDVSNDGNLALYTLRVPKGVDLYTLRE